MIFNDQAQQLVWVSRDKVVTQVLRAETRDDRIAVLVAGRAQVAEDCRAALARVNHPGLLS